MSNKKSFTLQDIEQECGIQEGIYTVDGRKLGLNIRVPAELHQQFPYNAPVYSFLQQLRQAIFDYGIIELPDLPVNKTNYTLAQRAPQQHAYSSNPYMTDYCQMLHQDTPPYPTAFGLEQPRRYFATWITSTGMLDEFYHRANSNPHLSVEALHRELVDKSLVQGSGILVNRRPGIVIFDNSLHQSLYHARTCQFDVMAANPDFSEDAPMYAFNEIGLMHYIDQLDSRRGTDHRDPQHRELVRDFMQSERLQG